MWWSSPFSDQRVRNGSRQLERSVCWTVSAEDACEVTGGGTGDRGLPKPRLVGDAPGHFS
ncbi:hypothetical protein PO909_004752 [Leuciscus waleckii]